MFVGPIPPLFDKINKLGAFSSLRSLYVHEEDLKGPLPRSIFAPNLEAFEYSGRCGGSESKVAANFLRAVILQTRCLTYLSMAGIFTASTFDILPPLPNLKHLALDGCICSITRYALSLKTLETLELGHTGIVIASPPPFVFGSLTELRIRSTFEHAKTILDAIRTPSLVRLYLSGWVMEPRIGTVDVDVAAVIQGFLRNNQQHARDKLRTLHISVQCSSTVTAALSLHLGSFDLKCLEHLDSLRIQAPLCISMSELESSLTTQPHWSNLQRMNLFDISVDSQLSIVALALIARSCFNLVQLKIGISCWDHSGVEDAMQHAGTLGQHHSLEELIFYRLPDSSYSPRSVNMLSSFLDTLFPDLITLRYQPYFPTSFPKELRWIWWYLVRDEWKSHQSRRRDGLVRNLHSISRRTPPSPNTPAY